MMLTPRRPKGALPDGWVTTEHTRGNGQVYKRFRGPDGERAQSNAAAWRIYNAGTGARGGGTAAGEGAA